MENSRKDITYTLRPKHGEQLSIALKRVRRARGLTQSELAIISGISRSRLSQLECGRVRTISAKTLKRLFEPFGLTVTVNHRPCRISVK